MSSLQEELRKRALTFKPEAQSPAATPDLRESQEPVNRVAEIAEVEAATAALRSADCSNSYIEIETADILLMGFRSMSEYDHYAEHMNRLILAAGGAMWPEEHDAHTRAYNERYGTCVALLSQVPVETGDKEDVRGNTSASTTTTTDTKLEVHMVTENSNNNDIAATVITNAINALKSMPPQEQANLLAQHGIAVPSIPTQSQYLASIDKSLGAMTAPKTPRAHIIETGKTLVGTAGGIGLAWIVYKTVEYFASPTE